MVWSRFMQFVAARLRHDHKTYVDISNTQVGEPFSNEVEIFLKQFVEETYALYAFRTAYTVAPNDRVLNLLDAAVCPALVYYPRSVWLSEGELQQVPVDVLERDYYRPSASSGTPVAWARTAEGEIAFDKACASAFTGCTVSGWKQHPTIADKEDDVLLPARILPVAAMFVAANLMIPVASDSVSGSRLQMYDKISYDAMRSFAAQNKARVYA